MGNYGKIRHIQKSNRILENRFLNEGDERNVEQIRIKFAEGGFNKFYSFYKPEKYAPMGEKYIENLEDGTGIELYDSMIYDFFENDNRTYFLEFSPIHKEIYIFPSEVGYRQGVNSRPEQGPSIYYKFNKLEVGEVDHRGYFEITELQYR